MDNVIDLDRHLIQAITKLRAREAVIKAKGQIIKDQLYLLNKEMADINEDLLFYYSRLSPRSKKLLY